MGGNAPLIYGPLDHADTGAALALSTAEGWNQTAADWARLTRLEPAGCFAAKEGHQLIGTVTTTTYAREMAWVGMMVVHPDFRGRGIGARLMRMVLDYLREQGVACVKLDATPSGRPLYESLGFVPEGELERWQGVTPHGLEVSPRPPHASPLDRLLTLDQSAYGVDRSRVLELLVTEGPGGPVVVEAVNGDAKGYALARPGRNATYLGPMVASSAAAAGQLLDGMLARVGGTEVCLDLNTGGLLEPSVLAERGLT